MQNDKLKLNPPRDPQKESLPYSSNKSSRRSAATNKLKDVTLSIPESELSTFTIDIPALSFDPTETTLDDIQFKNSNNFAAYSNDDIGNLAYQNSLKDLSSSVGKLTELNGKCCCYDF